MSKSLSVYSDDSHTTRIIRKRDTSGSAPGPNTKTVLVVDRHPLVADGIGSLVRQMEACREVLFAADVRQAIDCIRERLVDVVITRYVGDAGSLEVLRQVRNEDSSLPIVVLSPSQTSASVREAVDAGATAYVLETAPREYILQAINLGFGGERLALLPLASIAEAETRGGIPQQLREASGEAGERCARLTKQEANVLAHITEGLSNKEIARELGIFEGTVKVHVKAILRKLNAKNRTTAALMAVAAGCALQ